TTTVCARGRFPAHRRARRRPGGFPAPIGRRSFMLTRNRFIVLALLVLSLAAAPAWAIKPYTLVEDGYPDPVGQLDLENALESDFHPHDDTGFKQFSLENELEYQYDEKLALRVKAAYFYEDS